MDGWAHGSLQMHRKSAASETQPKTVLPCSHPSIHTSKLNLPHPSTTRRTTLRPPPPLQWLNKLLGELWPFYDRGICKFVKEFVEPVMESYRWVGGGGGWGVGGALGLGAAVLGSCG